MAIPAVCIILLSGMPATGKSTFARYLASRHDFAHYDLECHPRGWPHPELKSIWEASRQSFVRELRRHHMRIALDWGFPIQCLPIVRELQAEGARLIWFDGDAIRAREVYVQRSGIAVANFDAQVQALQAAGYPGPLNCTVVRTLETDGRFMNPDQIERIVFG